MYLSIPFMMSNLEEVTLPSVRLNPKILYPSANLRGNRSGDSWLENEVTWSHAAGRSSFDLRLGLSLLDTLKQNKMTK